MCFFGGGCFWGVGGGVGKGDGLFVFFNAGVGLERCVFC